MKLTTDRPFADPEKAARRLMQHAQPSRWCRMAASMKINARFLFGDRGTPEECIRQASRSPSNAADGYDMKSPTSRIKREDCLMRSEARSSWWWNSAYGLFSLKGI